MNQLVTVKIRIAIGFTEIWLAGKLVNMKATVEIPDDLYREAKIAAAMRGTKVKDLVAEGLRLVLRGEVNRPRRKRLKFPLIDAGEPGTLNIPDDAAAQLELMEDRIRNAASM
jgi:hypothetical protein